MSEKRNLGIMAGFVLSVSLIAVSLATLLLTGYFGRAQMRLLEEICQGIIAEQPEAKPVVLSVLKEYTQRKPAAGDGGNEELEGILQTYGYAFNDFMRPMGKSAALCAAAGFLAGLFLFLLTLLLRQKKESEWIEALTGYLEKINTGGGGILPMEGEDGFSRLQDEIYKTVTELYQTRDAALEARRNFADNLYNIAHQIKTPVTSISLSTQMMRENPSPGHLEKIQKQISRLTRLEEALLLLSRIDAGTLSLERRETDVYTILMLAADNLQELLSEAGVSVEIPESGEMLINVDMDWTMEAIMNFLKNCMEHTPQGGVIRCSYEQNPLYTKIRIWDSGAGFARKDIPHLFERFYRGQNAAGDGIGIGLSLSKAIIERQNGVVSAQNLAEGGACFEIRFYSH